MKPYLQIIKLILIIFACWILPIINLSLVMFINPWWIFGFFITIPLSYLLHLIHFEE